MNRVLSEEGKFCTSDADIRQNVSARTIDVELQIMRASLFGVANVFIRGNIAQ